MEGARSEVASSQATHVVSMGGADLQTFHVKTTNQERRNSAVKNLKGIKGMGP